MKALVRIISLFLVFVSLVIIVTAGWINNSTLVAVSGVSVASDFWTKPPAPELPRVSEPPIASAGVSLSPNLATSNWQEQVRQAKLDLVAPNAPVAPRQPFARTDLYYHLPTKLPANKMLRALVVLHGMDSRGDVFSHNLIADADNNGWLLIAPTMHYGDWTNPDQLLKDDLLYTRMLRDTLDTLPGELGVQLHQHVLLLGFSRGAQLAQRFAFFYPERVETVATMSGGAYTLPQENRIEQSGKQLLVLPFGVGDVQKHLGKPLNWAEFKKISFWIGVGANDNRKDDVPRMFDQYVGNNRLERAQNLYNSLCAVGIEAHISVFPNTDHELTADARHTALKFLHDHEVADNLND